MTKTMHAAPSDKLSSARLRMVFHAFTALYGVLCLYLFYNQSIADLNAETIRFQSDLPLHISMIVKDGWYYSFTAYAYKALHVLCQGSTVGIAVFLAFCSWGTVYAAERLVCTLSGWSKSPRTLLLSLSLNFVMPAFLPFVGEFRYVSYQSANIWHNSTYICMRLAALLALEQYFRLEKIYRNGLSLGQWCSFAFLNVITTGIKPSFLLAFSPIMGICLLIDLFRKVPFKRILVFGSALLPSGLVILWQNAVLFGSDTGNGITFDPWYTFSLHAAIPKLAVVCSVLFCALAVLATCKNLLQPQEKPYRILIAMALLGFLEALCLVESGARSVDGNFLWGYSFCLFALFTVTAVKWLSLPRTGWYRALRIGLCAVYWYHLYCGIYFFLQLLAGTSYWMR